MFIWTTSCFTSMLPRLGQWTCSHRMSKLEWACRLAWYASFRVQGHPVCDTRSRWGLSSTLLYSVAVKIVHPNPFVPQLRRTALARSSTQLLKWQPCGRVILAHYYLTFARLAPICQC